MCVSVYRSIICMLLCEIKYFIAKHKLHFGGEDSVHTCVAFGLWKISRGEGQKWGCRTQKKKMCYAAVNKLGRHPRAIYTNLQYQFQQL